MQLSIGATNPRINSNQSEEATGRANCGARNCFDLAASIRLFVHLFVCWSNLLVPFVGCLMRRAIARSLGQRPPSTATRSTARSFIDSAQMTIRPGSHTHRIARSLAVNLLEI